MTLTFNFSVGHTGPWPEGKAIPGSMNDNTFEQPPRVGDFIAHCGISWRVVRVVWSSGKFAAVWVEV